MKLLLHVCSLARRFRRPAYPCAVLALAGAGIFTAPHWPHAVTPAAEDDETLQTSVAELTVSEFTPLVQSEGTVSACDTISITTQVAGTVKRLAAGFEVSGFIAAGEIVAELDGVDYETAIVSARAQLARTEAACALEETRSQQARLNWEELGYQDKPGDLVLRIPQLSEAKAAVEAARAQLARAQRDLERTKIRVPYACRVLTRTVTQGQTLNANAVLGTIIAAGKAHVKLPIPPEDAHLLALPETSLDTPLEIELRTEADGPARRARIIRTEPQLDSETGALMATAAITEPYRAAGALPPLRIGQKVKATIRGAGFKDVTAVPRAAVADGNLIHLVSRDTFRLCRRTIQPLWMDAENVITRGLPGGSLLATGSDPALHEAPEGAVVHIVADHRIAGN
jgi:RND family efflux transporter MFP subunit